MALKIQSIGVPNSSLCSSWRESQAFEDHGFGLIYDSLFYSNSLKPARKPVSCLSSDKTLTWNGTYFQTQVTEIFLTHFFFLLMSSSYQRISQISWWGEFYSSGAPMGAQMYPQKPKICKLQNGQKSHPRAEFGI